MVSIVVRSSPSDGRCATVVQSGSLRTPIAARSIAHSPSSSSEAFCCISVCSSRDWRWAKLSSGAAPPALAATVAAARDTTGAGPATAA